MKLTLVASTLLACGFAASASAQKAVPITEEPHHHLSYTSERLRVFQVEVPGNSSTLLHEHAVDYFWISVGSARFINAVPGKPDARVVAADGSVHFTRGAFAHAARIDGPEAFHNITLELPLQQTNPRNLCEPVLPAEKTDCPAAMKHAAAIYSGVGVRPEFATDQTRVTLLTIAPNTTLTLAPSADRPVLVVVDNAPGTLPLICTRNGKSLNEALQAHAGTTYKITGAAPCTINNPTGAAVRFLAVEFTGPAR
jgi:hypothetical protein